MKRNTNNAIIPVSWHWSVNERDLYELLLGFRSESEHAKAFAMENKQFRNFNPKPEWAIFPSRINEDFPRGFLTREYCLHPELAEFNTNDWFPCKTYEFQ